MRKLKPVAPYLMNGEKLWQTLKETLNLAKRTVTINGTSRKGFLNDLEVMLKGLRMLILSVCHSRFQAQKK